MSKVKPHGKAAFSMKILCDSILDPGSNMFAAGTRASARSLPDWTCRYQQNLVKFSSIGLLRKKTWSIFKSLEELKPALNYGVLQIPYF